MFHHDDAAVHEACSLIAKVGVEEHECIHRAQSMVFLSTFGMMMNANFLGASLPDIYI